MRLPGEGYAMLLARCLGCGRVFMCDPDRVPTIGVAYVDGQPTVPAPGQPCSFEPVCPDCCRAANPHRRAAGLPLLPEADTLEDDGGWPQ